MPTTLVQHDMLQLRSLKTFEALSNIFKRTVARHDSRKSKDRLICTKQIRPGMSTFVYVNDTH